MILALVLMLLASGAYALGGAGSVVVDIVGSSAENTKIITSGLGPIELELVGSEANNTTIAPPEEHRGCHKCCRHHEECESEERWEAEEQSAPWEGRHLGVDAWYGTFWYTNINTPEWPHY